MAILRVDKSDNYTVIHNAVFYDYSLSFKAKGLLCQMLSLPDGWSFSIEGLAKLGSDGRDSVASTLKELERAGYFRREQNRNSGKFQGIEYIVSEKPFAENPITEKPITEKPIPNNPRQLNTKELNTNKSTTKRFKVPSTEEVQEYIDEKGYSVDAERFVDYYTANGWMVGKNHMKDWKATVRNWERKNGTNLGTSYTVRGGVSENSGGTYGGSSENRERTRTKLPPMAALSNEPE